MGTICCIPSDNENNLFIKDARIDGQSIFVKYRSTYNDIPFIETELIFVDSGKNLAITGSNGTVLFRFSAAWVNKLIEQ